MCTIVIVAFISAVSGLADYCPCHAPAESAHACCPDEAPEAPIAEVTTACASGCCELEATPPGPCILHTRAMDSELRIDAVFAPIEARRAVFTTTTITPRWAQAPPPTTARRLATLSVRIC